ncbi:MAG: hypothetical protein M3273_00210 [Actinomycetota bacterium]|nr:hypothetical protein [Actinomycetota bacterium]
MDARLGTKRMSMSLSLVVGILAGLAVASPPSFGDAADEPKIAFLNPSSFSFAGERGYIVSNSATDVGPDCCAASDGAFRFSAWVHNAPAGSTVFFSVVQGALDFEITGSSQTPADTWDAEWEMPPEVLNGPATVYAYLVYNGEAVAQAQRDVTIMRVEPSIDLAYPTSGGSFGTFAALATALPDKGAAERKKPMGTVDALYTGTPDMSYVRAFYTTSAPGTDPRWQVCATEAVGSNNNNADNGLRCTMSSAEHALSVTAVAAVANDSPNDYDERFNESGDAVRVVPYVQQPTELALSDAAEQRVDKNVEADRFYCTSSIGATLTDQLGRPIPAANVDVKAAGPTDGLKFHTSIVFASPVAPDRGNHVEEAGFDCTGSNPANGVPSPNASPSTQGEHPLFGSPDVKHVESAAGGTSDRGSVSFRLYSNSAGVTHYTAWVDEADDGCLTNDDRFIAGEVAAAGSIGWNHSPDVPAVRTPDTPVACSPDGATPTPTPSPTEPEPAARSVRLRASDRNVAAGSRVRLAGRLASADETCVADQALKLKARRPGGRFHAIASGRTGTDGRYRFAVAAKKTRSYRVVTPATEGCAGARSRTVRVRAS